MHCEKQVCSLELNDEPGSGTHRSKQWSLIFYQFVSVPAATNHDNDIMHTSINMRAFVTAASCRIVSTMRVLGSDEERDMDGESLLRVGDAEGEGVELEPPKPNIRFY